MIVVCTDYGSSIYTGQVTAKILTVAPQTAIVNLIDDLPAFNVQASAYLLNALMPYTPEQCIVLAVVDPGVGTDRAPICFKCESRWFIGPDNGLFSRILHEQSDSTAIYRIISEDLSENSATFHGRDVFGPAAARLALDKGDIPKSFMRESVTEECAKEWSGDLAELIYFDHFGNGFTGVRADSVDAESKVVAAGQEFRSAHKFADVKANEGFWYRNSIGLIEIAVNQGNAKSMFSLEVGMPVSIH